LVSRISGWIINTSFRECEPMLYGLCGASGGNQHSDGETTDHVRHRHSGTGFVASSPAQGVTLICNATLTFRWQARISAAV
jgi:hypothetical protein